MDKLEDSDEASIVNTNAFFPSLHISFNTSRRLELQQINEILVPLALILCILKSLQLRDVMITVNKACVQAITPWFTFLYSPSVDATSSEARTGEENSL